VLSVPHTIDASKLLRPGLLDSVVVLIASVPDGAAGDVAGDGSLAQAVGSACAGLGARVSSWPPGDVLDAATDMLVIDCASPFACPSAGETQTEPDTARAVLSACLQGAWEATRAVANAAFIDPGRPGRIVYLAPRPGAGHAGLARHVEAARAGVENLARTLSIEWARYGVTTVTIAPGTDTTDHEIAALVAYLGSPAGAYFSGCLFDLSGPGA
jgi:NAD(P)-dependent dehydrogenase (short-subunit alcohol dehydrogenase family)